MRANLDMLDEAEFVDVPARIDMQDEADLADIPAPHTSPLKVILGLLAGAVMGLLVAKLLLWALIS